MPGSRHLARWMFYAHLWLGVIATGLLVVISVTGIMLNHKRALGYMPDAPDGVEASLTDALPLARVVDIASTAAGAEVAASGVDRMDVRPSSGQVKVRFDDPEVTEVTIDLSTGDVLEVGPRNDVFIEKLHSGEIFGDAWVLLSDAGAIFLLITLVSGYWLWLYPRARASRRRER